MPRPLRIEFDGAWYHVMNRGANHGAIFLETKHYHSFLSLLEYITIKFQIEIHAYCLMANHYHLLIHTPRGNLAKAMRYLDGVYTQRHNRNLNKDGPLFRGRYKAILIDSNTYLLQVSRYIHLNPVEANICKHAALYRWSSYHCYVFESPKNKWLVTSTLTELIGRSDWRSYEVYIDDGIDDELRDFYSKEHLSSVLGDSQFKKKHLENIDQVRRREFSTDLNFTERSVEIKKVELLVMTYFKITKQELLRNKRGKLNFPKLIAIYLSHLLTSYNHTQIGHYFGLARASVASAVYRTKQLIQTQESFKNDIVSLSDAISKLPQMTP